MDQWRASGHGHSPIAPRINKYWFASSVESRQNALRIGETLPRGNGEEFEVEDGGKGRNGGNGQKGRLGPSQWKNRRTTVTEQWGPQFPRRKTQNGGECREIIVGGCQMEEERT